MPFIKVEPLETRFWKKVLVRELDDCWEWTATKRRGYGLFKIDGKHRQATRVAFELAGGTIPDGFELDHLCRNVGCVNPNHLEPVTPKENNHRSTSPSAINAAKELCIRGHRLSDENLFIRRDGGRTCRTCHTVSKRKYENKIREANHGGL